MITLEQVEKLREHASVSYEEAKAALEACGGDLLDAMVYLERQGKVKGPEGGASYRTDWGEKAIMRTAAGSSGGGSGTGAGNAKSAARSAADSFWRTLGDLLKKGISNHFEVLRKGELLFSIPVIVLIFLLLFTFWITLPLMILGLFLGCSYHFRGPELGTDAVNNVAQSASDVAEDIKKAFTRN